MSNKGFFSFIVAVLSSIMIAEGFSVFILPLLFSVIFMVGESKDKKI
jgi:hypothetical protein